MIPRGIWCFLINSDSFCKSALLKCLCKDLYILRHFDLFMLTNYSEKYYGHSMKGNITQSLNLDI